MLPHIFLPALPERRVIVRVGETKTFCISLRSVRSKRDYLLSCPPSLAAPRGGLTLLCPPPTRPRLPRPPWQSSEPVFSVVMSTLLMRESYSPWVWLSLVPIVLGCSLSAMKEVSLGLGGVTGAMTSNVAFVLRNIFSKREMEKLKDVDGINFYGVISIISMLYLAPVALVVEGSKWSAGWAAALGSGFTPFDLVKLIGASGLFYHLYNQSSFMCLDAGISPVSFSVANSMKRVVVIVSSIIFFRNFVAPLNWAGMAMACVGAYLYTVAKRRNDA